MDVHACTCIDHKQKPCQKQESSSRRERLKGLARLLYYCYAIIGVGILVAATVSWVLSPGDGVIGCATILQNIANWGALASVDVDWDETYTPGHNAFVITATPTTGAPQIWAIGVGMSGEYGDLPISFVVKTAGFLSQITMGNIRTGGPTLAQVVSTMSSAMKACLEDMCDAEIVGMGSYTYTPPGFALSFLSYQSWMAVQENDVALCVLIGQDVNQAPGHPLQTVNNYCPGYGGQTGSAVIAMGSAQSSPPLDLDIGVNNGAQIFSVNSTTFTERGS